MTVRVTVRVAVRVAVASRPVQFFGTAPRVVADFAAHRAPRRFRVNFLHRHPVPLYIVPTLVVVRGPAHAARLWAERASKPGIRRGLYDPSVELGPAAGSSPGFGFIRGLTLDRGGRLLPGGSPRFVRYDPPRRGRVRGHLPFVKVSVLVLEVLLQVDVVLGEGTFGSHLVSHLGSRGAARLEIPDGLAVRRAPG